MILAIPFTGRICIVIFASGILSLPSVLYPRVHTLVSVFVTVSRWIVFVRCFLSQSAGLIRENMQEVGQARNLENLDIMVAQTTGLQAAALFAGAGQQAHDQGNTGTVDIMHISEVEQNNIQFTLLSLSIGVIENVLSAGIDFAV